jgi:hypothetical protein
MIGSDLKELDDDKTSPDLEFWYQRFSITGVAGRFWDNG